MKNRKTALTSAEQQARSPQAVFEQLQAGNLRYVNGTPNQMDASALRSETVDGQHPQAVVLSCIDSRVPVEMIFDQYIGDIFVARVAGNFENPDILGSMEYACAVAGSKLIVVLGHAGCGAMSSMTVTELTMKLATCCWLKRYVYSNITMHLMMRK